MSTVRRKNSHMNYGRFIEAILYVQSTYLHIEIVWIHKSEGGYIGPHVFELLYSL